MLSLSATEWKGFINPKLTRHSPGRNRINDAAIGCLYEEVPLLVKFSREI
jgi:hypothetical protein